MSYFLPLSPQFVRRAIAVALAMSATVMCGCSNQPAQTANSTADASASRAARPSASEIQERLNKVQADPKLSSEAKALLSSQMQAALRDQKATTGP